MVGLDYVINLLDKNFSGGMAAAKKHTQGLDDAVGKTNQNTRGLAKSSKQGFGGMVKWAKRAAVATGLIFGLGQAIAFGNEVTNVTAKMEGYTNAIEFASGADGAKNLQFLDDTIKNLSLDIDSSYSGFQTLSGSLKGTALEGKATRDIFESVGIAASVMNLSADQSKGAFLALSQMASKGKVQAEELRGQLGERIPGALGIAARSMGVTQAKLNDMLDNGEVYANDFLPKFAKELKKTFQDGLPAAANSMQAAINKKNNALLTFKNAFGTYMRPAIVGILNLKAKFFAFMEQLLPKLRPIWESFKNIGSALSPLTDRFSHMGTAIGGTQGLLDGIKFALDALAIVVEIAANGIGFLIDIVKPFAPILAGVIAAQWAWNIAMTANPIGLIIAGIAALAGGLIYAYEKVGWFRGAIKGTWAALKEFGTLLKTMIIDRFKQMLSGMSGIAQAFHQFFVDGDWKKAWDTGKDAIKNLTGYGVGNGDKLKNGLKKVALKGVEGYVEGLEEAEANANKKSSLFDVTSKTKIASNSVFGTNTNEIEKLKGDQSKKQKLSGSVSGGSGSTKNVTFKIESLVKQITITPQTLKEGTQDIEKQVKDIFIRLVRDVELQHN